MNKLLTFSIAAFNVEDYLPKLFDTLLDIRYADKIEVLVINDGSGDGTARIAEDYEHRFPDTVRLVNKENGGHGSTINRGIKEAKGKYFRALDGDDWVDCDGLYSLLMQMETTDADMILTNYYKCYQNGQVKLEKFDHLENGKLYSFEEIAPLAKWMRYHTVIYKTAILQVNQICLDENCFYVDAEFMIYPIPYINTVAFYEYGIYCYRLGEEGQSVSPTSRMKHCAHSNTVVQSLLKMYENLPGNLSSAKRNYIQYGIAGHCIWHFRTIMTFPPSHEKKKELKRFERQVRNQSEDIFKKMEQQGSTSRLIKAMRRSKYLLYYPAGWLKYIKNKGK